MYSILLPVLLSFTAPSSAAEPFSDPGMFSCGSVTAVAANGADVAAPGGCSESWDTATVGNAEFFYELNQAVNFSTLKHGTDLITLAKKHGISIPTGMTTATIDLTSSHARLLAAETAELALELPGECGGVDDPLDLKIICVRVRINRTLYSLCLECNFTFSGDFRSCFVTLTED